MTDLESRPNAALRADAPPEWDPVFQFDVLVRREGARFRRQFTLTVAPVSGVAILAAINARAVSCWVGADAGRFAMVAVLAAAAVEVVPGSPFRGIARPAHVRATRRALVLHIAAA